MSVLVAADPATVYLFAADIAMVEADLDALAASVTAS